MYTEGTPRIIRSMCWQMAGHISLTDRLKEQINQYQKDTNRVILWVTLKGETG